MIKITLRKVWPLILADKFSSRMSFHKKQMMHTPEIKLRKTRLPEIDDINLADPVKRSEQNQALVEAIIPMVDDTLE